MAMGQIEAMRVSDFRSDEAAVNFTLSIGLGNVTTATLKPSDTDANHQWILRSLRYTISL